MRSSRQSRRSPTPLVPRSRDDPASVGLTRKAPLAGLRIIAVEQFGAGPFGTLYLSDLGAEVIKIEDPATGGDVSRFIPPGHVGTDSLYFEAFNRGKKSIALDLKNPAGREVFERLVASADAVYSNLRGGQPERLGLTYEEYTLEILERGRHLQIQDVERIAEIRRARCTHAVNHRK